MRIEYQFRNLAHGETRFREHAEPRLEHLAHTYERVQAVRLTVTAQRNWRTVDVTVDVNGALLRAEERSDDFLAAFDAALGKIERQLKRFKERIKDFNHDSLRHLAGTEEATHFVAPAEEPAEDVELEGIQIVRTKVHTLKPMTPEEACLQMELLGHDFFVFVDGETQRVGVVYKRRAGGYGLIEPGVRA